MRSSLEKCERCTSELMIDCDRHPMLYCESVRIKSGVSSIGTVSSTRMMAYELNERLHVASKRKGVDTYDQLCTIIRLRARTPLGDVSSLQWSVNEDGSTGETCLESPTPQYTPTPAILPVCPFPLQAPSQ